MAMIKHLEEIFKNVNEWLKFAEAKNASLIAFNAGFIFGISNISDIKDNIFFLIIIFILSISLILCLISFLPQIKIFDFLQNSEQNEEIGDDDNLLFYGDIKKYKAIDYLKKLDKALNESPSSNDRNDFLKIERDYANQIIINSKIAYKKYTIFKRSLWLILAGMVTFTIVITSKLWEVL